MTAKKQPNEKDYITNKVLLVFSMCLLGVLGLMMLFRLINTGSTAGIGLATMKIVLVIGIIGLVGGLVKLWLEHKNKADMRYRLWRGRSITIVFAVWTATMLCITYLGYPLIKIFYVVLPAIAVLYLIYHSYPREFFVVAIDCGVAASLLWFVRTALNTSNYSKAAWAAVAVAAVLLVLQVVLIQRVRKTGCKGLVDGKMTELFTAPHAYFIMLATGAIMAVLVLAGVLLGAQIAYYLVFAAFAYLFVSAVYYTVKML